MIRKKIDELTGEEVLAQDILNKEYKIILSQGSVIREDYISKLKDIGILEVFVREPGYDAEEIAILKSDIGKSVKETVRGILEHHTYRNNRELVELSETADDIISTILEERQVVEKIFDIRERSADIYEHSVSICSLTILTALKLGMDIEKIHELGVGCLLHDIGMRYMTIDYINQDVETMNNQELIEYKKHPIYGYSSLQRETWISDLSKSVILYHHERLDGSGFPLRTKEIPFECRIVNVCDAFDEMICGIGCSQTKVYKAVEYLKSFKGILFDEEVVNAFLEFTAVYPAGSVVLTSEGEIALVLAQNQEFQDRPVLRILKDKNGNEIKERIIKDLVKVQNVFIEKALD